MCVVSNEKSGRHIKKEDWKKKKRNHEIGKWKKQKDYTLYQMLNTKQISNLFIDNYKPELQSDN